MQPIDLDGRRVALVMMSAIGDVVHALPLVSSLRAAAPAMHLTWVIQRVPLELVREHPAVDDFVLFRRELGFHAFPKLRRSLAGRRFDLVLDPHVYFKAGLVTAMLRAPRRIGFDRVRAPDLNWLFTNERLAPRPRGHIQDEVLEFADHLGVPRVLEWGLGSTPQERERYGGLLAPAAQPRVALVGASSSAAKDWPAERYLELNDRIVAELGARTVLIGGRSAAEDGVAALLLERAQHPPLDLRAWDLRRLVYLIESVDVLVAPDTGPMHLAVALGTPTVALMGPTNPKRFGPYRYRELMVDAFGEPGEDYSPLEPRRTARMQRITPAQVLARVRAALERYGALDRLRSGAEPAPAAAQVRVAHVEQQGRSFDGSP